ncbi:MAG: family 20 glycosylhydrolase, partial [Lentisphaeria bacterium]
SMRYNQAPDAICVGKKISYEVIENIIKELVEIFSSPYFHLGGDEVNDQYWRSCDDCNELLKIQQLTNYHQLQDYFTKEVSNLAKKYAKEMIGWDEINNRGAASVDNVIMCWRDRGFTEAAKALLNGQKVILSPQYGCYFDWGYGGNSTRFVYEWDPITWPITEDLSKNILGIQACLWTEKVADVRTLQQRLFPRLAAIAENAWYGGEKDLADFSKRLELMKKQWQFRKIAITEDSLENRPFDPDRDEKVLVRNAKVSTNLPTFYAKEFAFDGRENSFFWSGAPANKNSWFLVELGEIMAVKKVKVITGDSKDYLDYGVLEISEDGENFEKIADFKDGIAEASNLNKKIRKVRVRSTANHTGWLIIREIILE